MDPSVQPTPTVSKPFICPSLPSRPILITAFLVTMLLSFLAGYFSSKLTNINSNPSTISTKSGLPASIPLQILTTNLPIESSSSAVKSLWVVYLLTGVIDNIAHVTNNNVNGYEIQISSPTGPLVNQKFFVNDQANIVRLDNKSKEIKYQLSNIKKGDSIQLNYQLDIKKQSAAQVTKIIVLQ